MKAATKPAADFRQDDQADFRRRIGIITKTITDSQSKEHSAKKAWKEARLDRKEALAELLAIAAQDCPDLEQQLGQARREHAQAVEKERELKQHWVGHLTARRRAQEELCVFIDKWAERLPLFEPAVNGNTLMSAHRGA